MARSLMLPVILLSLNIFGAISLHGFANSNGFFDLIERVGKKRVLPDKNINYGNKIFTGIQSVDDTLLVIVSFFWPLVQGENPGLGLLGILFSGQSIAGWTITLVEGYRRGNRSKVASWTTSYGLIMQSIGFAILGPAWLLLHSLTSPTVSNPTANEIEVPEASIRAIPYSIGLGFILPSILMALPYPAVWSANTKINIILAWQIFPLYVQVIQYLLERTIFATSAPMSRVKQLWLLNGTYKFAMFVSVWINVAVCGISIAAWTSPEMFEHPGRLYMTPQAIFSPPNPFDKSVKAVKVSQGTMWFLQWDYLISGGAYMIWALWLKYGRVGRKWSITEVIGDIAIKPWLMGLMGAALSHIAARDEEVLDAADAVEKKTL